jgi:hypothetical protein
MQRFLTIILALCPLVLLAACGVPSDGTTDRSQPQPNRPTASAPISMPAPSATPQPERPTVEVTAQVNPAASATASAVPTAVQARPQGQPSITAPVPTQATLPCSPSPSAGGAAQLPQSGASSGQVGAAGQPIPVSTSYPANAPNQATREAALDRVNRSGPVAGGSQATPCP